MDKNNQPTWKWQWMNNLEKNRETLKNNHTTKCTSMHKKRGLNIQKYENCISISERHELSRIRRAFMKTDM